MEAERPLKLAERADREPGDRNKPRSLSTSTCTTFCRGGHICWISFIELRKISKVPRLEILRKGIQAQEEKNFTVLFVVVLLLIIKTFLFDMLLVTKGWTFRTGPSQVS